MPTTFQTDYSEALNDPNVQEQVTMAIYAEAATVYTEQVTTSIAAASNGAVLPQATLTVGSTTGFPTSGTLLITIGTVTTTVNYTGTTSTTFTGCSGGAGTLATGNTVSSPANHSARAQFAHQVATGQQPLQPLIFSAVAFASLNGSSTDTTASNAAAALWNLWSGA